MKHLLSLLLILGVSQLGRSQNFIQQFIVGYDIVEDAAKHIFMDYDGDGDLDAIAGGKSATGYFAFCLYKNNGQGVFDESEMLWRSAYTITEGLVDFEVRDINNDGLLEIIMATNTGETFYDSIDNSLHLYIMEYQEHGPEVWPYDYNVQYALLTESGLKFNDIDNDGDLDLAVVHNVGTWASPVYVDKWLLKTGGLTWSTLIPSATSHVIPNIDMNDDGLLDLAISSFSSTNENFVFLRRNLGNGLFSPYQREYMPNGFGKAIYDVNMDGLPDLINVKTTATPGSYRLLWKVNNGNFVFGNENQWFNLDVGHEFLTFYDYDFDGDSDLILKNTATNLLVARPTLPDGTFGPAIGIPNYPEIYASIALGSFRLMNTPMDLNGDTTLDMLVSEKTGDCNMKLVTDVDSTPVVSSSCAISGIGKVFCISGNFDSDPELDVITIPSNPDSWGQYALIEDWADPVNSHYELLPTSVSTDTGIRNFMTLDMDDDGLEELVMVHYQEGSYSGENMLRIYGLVNGVLTEKGTFNYPTSTFTSLTCRDFNGDGRADLFTSNFKFLMNNGDLTFSIVESGITGVASDSSILFEDMQGDGACDIIYPLTSGTFYLSMNEEAVVQAPVLIGPSGIRPVAMIGHLESDGGFICSSTVIPSEYFLLQRTPQGSYNLLNVYENFVPGGLNADFDNDGGWDYLGPDRNLVIMHSGVLNWEATHQDDYYFGVNSPVVVNNLQSKLKDINNDGWMDYCLTVGANWGSGTVLFARVNRLFFGCADPIACNYNPTAQEDDGSCCYAQCGCTNADACNFDANAICDDGSCTAAGCMDIAACNYDENASCDNGSCEYSLHLEITLTSILNGSAPIYPNVWLVNTDNPGGWAWNSTEYFGEMSIDDDGTTTLDFGCLPYECFRLNLTSLQNFDADDEVEMQIHQNGNLIHYDTYLPYLLMNNPPTGVSQYSLPAPFAVEWMCFCPEEANTGCLNPFAFNYDEEAECNDGRCMFQVSGRVFYDENQNGVFDTNDYGLAFQEVTLYPDEYTIITNDQGFYFAEIPWGNFILTHTPSLTFPYYTTPESYSFSSGLNSGNTYNFGLSNQLPMANVCIDLYPCWYVCNTYVNFNICFRNEGNEILDGIVMVEMDELYTGYNAVTPIDSVVGNTLYYSFVGLMPGQMFMYDVEFFTPTTDFMGEELVSSATVQGFVNGQMVATGYITRAIIHACSYDPNDKTGYPFGYTDAHFVDDGTSIEYLVRFQNTGTAPALHVRIEDQIDPNLDIESFQLVANSHSVIASLNEETRELIFYFNEIMLPDSFSDEPGSNGMVSYRMRLNEDLNPGTTINNTAYIYFDFNDPVITNTTLHTVFECDDYASSFETVSSENCGETSVVLASTSAWTEQYSWMVDGLVAGTEPNYTCTSPGVHEIELAVTNPLCGLRFSSQTIVVDAPILASITGDNSELCLGEVAEFSAAIGAGQWTWSFDGMDLGSEATVEVDQPGVLSLNFVAGDCELTSEVVIVQATFPVIGAIEQFQNILAVDNAPGAMYQWYLAGEAIVGAVQNSVEIVQSGSYTVEVTFGECTIAQNLDALYIGVEEITFADFELYPNPTTGRVNMVNSSAQILDLVLYNAVGQEIKQLRLLPGVNAFDLSELPTGIYTIQGGDRTLKLVLVK